MYRPNERNFESLHDVRDESKLLEGESRVQK